MYVALKQGEREHIMQVLVVDDEEAVRRLVSAAMSEQGHQVWAAGSGKEALELAAVHAFDLVFSDVAMDGLNGFDLLSILREEHGSGRELRSY